MNALLPIDRGYDQDRMTTGFALFDTAIGTCAMAWNDRGVASVRLPEGPAVTAGARMRRRFPGAIQQAPPPDVQRAIDGIVSLLRGESVDLAFIALDTTGIEPFNQRVYDLARRIPPGRTMTYGEIAIRLGAPGSARAVGQALGRNPFPIVVPCHRVLAANGGMGGFSAPGGVDTKRRLLEIEGVRIGETLRMFG
jgi:methylated-DNA-[protein]-cysteine S-methyltransferase